MASAPRAPAAVAVDRLARSLAVAEEEAWAAPAAAVESRVRVSQELPALVARVAWRAQQALQGQADEAAPAA